MLEVDTRLAVFAVFLLSPGASKPLPRMLACCSPSLYAADSNGLDTRASARCLGNRDKNPPFFKGEVGELATSAFDKLAEGAKG